MANLCEETGDVLLQVVFHAQIEAEKGGYTLDDVLRGVCEKMIYRHPHVFSTVSQSKSISSRVIWESCFPSERAEFSTYSNLFINFLIAFVVCEKMIYRHPHVFSTGVTAETPEEVLVNWEALKKKEKTVSQADSLLKLPAFLENLFHRATAFVEIKAHICRLFLHFFGQGKT